MEEEEVIERLKPVASFPTSLTRKKAQKHEQEFLETFRNVEVNIPLFDLMKGVPRYAKFLKQLCTNKRSYDIPSKKKVK